MKSFKYFSLLVFLSMLFVSCEKVIPLDLEEGQKRLVVDARIDWDRSTSSNEQVVVLSQTYPYFSDATSPKVSGAKVWISDTKGRIFNFSEQGQKGFYKTSSFISDLDELYTLHIEIGDTEYNATSQILPAPTALEIEQEDNGGFSGDATIIRGYFVTSSASERTSYIVQIDRKEQVTSNYIILYGHDFQRGVGQFVYSSKELKAGDELVVRVYAVTREYLDYFNQILSVSNSSQGGKPFTASPSIVRGNIVNEHDHDNNPLGYFRIAQFLEQKYVVQ